MSPGVTSGITLEVSPNKRSVIPPMVSSEVYTRTNSESSSRIPSENIVCTPLRRPPRIIVYMKCFKDFFSLSKTSKEYVRNVCKKQILRKCLRNPTGISSRIHPRISQRFFQRFIQNFFKEFLQCFLPERPQGQNLWSMQISKI